MLYLYFGKLLLESLNSLKQNMLKLKLPFLENIPDDVILFKELDRPTQPRESPFL